MEAKTANSPKPETVSNPTPEHQAGGEQASNKVELTRKFLEESLGEIVMIAVDLEQNAQSMIAEKVKRDEAARRTKEAGVIGKMREAYKSEKDAGVATKIWSSIKAIPKGIKNAIKNTFWAKSYRENKNFIELNEKIRETGDLLGEVIEEDDDSLKTEKKTEEKTEEGEATEKKAEEDETIEAEAEKSEEVGKNEEAEERSNKPKKTKLEKIAELENLTLERFEEASKSKVAAETMLGTREKINSKISPETKANIEAGYATIIERAYRRKQAGNFDVDKLRKELANVARGNRSLALNGKIGIDNFAKLNKQIEEMFEKIDVKKHELSMEAVQSYFAEKAKLTVGSGRIGAEAKTKVSSAMKAALGVSGALGLSAGIAAAVTAIGGYGLKRETKLKLGLGLGLGGLTMGAIYGGIAGFSKEVDMRKQNMIKEAYGEGGENYDLRSMEDLTAMMKKYGAKENEIGVIDGKEKKLTAEDAADIDNASIRAYAEAMIRLKRGGDKRHDLLKTEGKGIDDYEKSKLELKKAILEMRSKVSQFDEDQKSVVDNAIEEKVAGINRKIRNDKLKTYGAALFKGAKRAAMTGLAAYASVNFWRGVKKAVTEDLDILKSFNSKSIDEITDKDLRAGETINPKAGSLESYATGEGEINPSVDAGEKRMGVLDFMETKGGVKMERAGWRDDAVIGDWKTVMQGDRAMYEVQVWGKNGRDLPEGMKIALTASRDTQGMGMLYEVENGVVRIPADSDIGRSLFEQNASGELNYKGAFTELVEERPGGGMLIHSTDIGSNTVGEMTVEVKAGVEILNETTGAGVASAEEIVDIYKGVSNPNSKLVELAEDINLRDGKVVDLFKMNNGYNKIMDEALLPRFRSSHVGGNFYNSEASGAEMLEDYLKSSASSPNLLAQMGTILGIKPEVDTVGELNAWADDLRRNPSEMESLTTKIYEKLRNGMRGGDVEVVNLSNGYTRSTFLTKINGLLGLGVARDGFAGSGHGLRLVDAAGRNLIDGQQEGMLKAMMGIPAGEEGEFLLRAECGGQLVWVPDQPAPPIDDLVTPSEDPNPIPESPIETPEVPGDTPENPPHDPPENPPYNPPENPPENPYTSKNPEDLIRNQTPGQDMIDQMEAGELTEDPANINKDELIIEEESGEKGWEGTEEEAGNKFEEEFGGGDGGTTQPTEPIDAPVGSGGDEGGLQPEPTPGEPTQEPDPGELTPEPGTGENGLNEAARATASAGATKVQDLPFFHNYSDEELEALKNLAS